jgi:Mrp family chromosome partitioning ATPase
LSTHAAPERSAGEYPDLARVARLVRRWWPALLIAAAIGGFAAAQAGSRTEKIYEAQTRLLVGPLDGPPNALRAAAQQSQTLSQLATSRPVLDAARRRLGTRAPADMAQAVRADATGATRVLIISARTGTPANAALTANTIAAELQELMHAPGTTLLRGTPLVSGRLRVIDPADPPPDSVGTGLTALVAAAALAGLLGALGLVLFADYFRGRIADEDELRELSGIAHLGAVGRSPRRRGRLAMDRPLSETAAGYRLLAGRVALTAPGRQRRTFLVAGAQPGDAAGQVAAEFAAALAATGAHVVLVDADDDAGEVSRMFRLEGHAGLGELLDQPLTARSRLRLNRVAVESASGLRVLPRGALDPHDLLAPERAQRALERLGRVGDVIVVSGGPASGSAAALGWARLVEGTILVGRRGHTRRDAVTRAVEALDQVGATVLGTVLADGPGDRLASLRDAERALRQRLARLRPAPPAPDPEGARGLIS